MQVFYTLMNAMISTMFKTLLIANRGEIACRIIRTAKRMGLRCVAVYSSADAHAKHVKLADEAYLIGDSAPRESYLHIERILQAAKQAKACAIHPGYGFLAENALFAKRCMEAGIVFVGPSSDAIMAMGDKSAAKQRMMEAGIPILPGYHGDEQDLDYLHQQAQTLGYPLLIKPSAGGGGKGMHIVRQDSEFLSAAAASQREALSAFGDARLLLERYLEHPRHIEVQIFADEYGNVVHLFERDCSIQRRHQKIIEEAPAHGLDDETRTQLGSIAVQAARAIDYVGAGTIEFLYSLEGEAYFMEMNTRLQVEHAVTEMITGQDLVEWQLRVAAGERLPCTQEQIHKHGHAIEARIYAEDPAHDFLPASGRLQHVQFPTQEYIRTDTGVQSGDLISPFYDPMLAKCIAYGPDRSQAIARLKQALDETEIVGIPSNRALLRNILAHTVFQQGLIDTHFIEQHAIGLRGNYALTPSREVLAMAALAIATAPRLAASRADPWACRDGWRLHEEWTHTVTLIIDSHPITIALHAEGDSFSVRLATGGMQARLEWQDEHSIRLHTEHTLYSARIFITATCLHIYFKGDDYIIDLPQTEHAHAAAETDALHVRAPMTATVTTIQVKMGDAVQLGQTLISLEAMKMEHLIKAPHQGIIKDILYAVGDLVDEGAELLVFEVE